MLIITILAPIVSKEPLIETKTEARSITSISIPRMWKIAVSQSLKNPHYRQKTEARIINSISIPIMWKIGVSQSIKNPQ